MMDSMDRKTRRAFVKKHCEAILASCDENGYYSYLADSLALTNDDVLHAIPFLLDQNQEQIEIAKQLQVLTSQDKEELASLKKITFRKLRAMELKNRQDGGMEASAKIIAHGL